MCTSVRGQSTGEQRPAWRLAPLEGTCEQCTGCTTSSGDPSSSLASAFAGEKHRERKRNWLEERQRKVSVAPCPEWGWGGGGGEQRGGGAVRKLCVIAQSQCKPRGHFFSLCVLPSAWRVVIRMLHGSLWGADWEPSHHMVNKCGNRPTAERLLHVIKWQQPLP